MKLTELAAKPAQSAAKVFESYFGKTIRFDDVTRKQARQMLHRVRSLVREHRSTREFHQSEQNPTYLKLIMLEQVLSAKLKEVSTVAVGSTAGSNFNQQMSVQGMPPANPVTMAGNEAKRQTMQAQQQAAQAQQNQMQQQSLAAQKASTAAVAQNAQAAKANAQTNQAAAAHQSMAEDEKSMSKNKMRSVNKPVASAKRVNESEYHSLYRLLREDEVQQAQVVLAAQDMVDKVQKMIEDVTAMQFKDLPALVDQVKNQVGVEQSTQFSEAATAALAGLVQNLQGSKQQLESAVGIVTGQPQPQVPGSPDEAGDEMGADLGMDAQELGGGDELGGAPSPEEFEEPEAPEGGAGPELGRKRR